MIIKFLGWVTRVLEGNWHWAAFSLLLLSLTGVGWWGYEKILRDLPNVNQIYAPPSLSSKIRDRNGRLLYKFYKEEDRSWISLDRIPQSLVWATLAIEDKEFFSHHGLSVKGIIGAIVYNFKKDEESKMRGGSTITQQLVKNVFFGPEKTWERKFREAILTIQLERKLNKEEILERYFNQVPYGGEAYGVEEAAWRYFGKNVWEINMAQATFLAGLPAAPSSYSPFGPNRDLALARQRRVIDEMVKAGFISNELGEELKKEDLELVEAKVEIEAPHFVFYVKDLLESKYGFTNFEKRGLTVYTSLDYEVQQMAEKVVADEVAKVEKLRISNGAAMVVDVKQGDILAMVGSKNYFAGDIDGKYNVTTALRQPGSMIKPINYLLALENGYSLASVVDDSPVTYFVPGQEPYNPQNYNGKYMGKVTLRTALGSSLNVPSVKLLAQNGVSSMIDLAERMGITTWKDRSRFGLALALGGGEVKMAEIAQAYSIFANMGEMIEIQPILKVENYLGETVFQKTSVRERVIEAPYAFLINNALSDNGARTPIFGPNSLLKINGKTVAVKTGTTNSLKDNWCVGWTPSYLVATWVGNNDSSPMSWVASGVSGATPIWHQIMDQMIREKADEKWEVPEGVYQSEVCGRQEYMVAGGTKNIECPNQQEGKTEEEKKESELGHFPVEIFDQGRKNGVDVLSRIGLKKDKQLTVGRGN